MQGLYKLIHKEVTPDMIDKMVHPKSEWSISAEVLIFVN